MEKRIIYKTDEGGVAVIIPADCGLTIREIAAKDVPEGKPYKIVDSFTSIEDENGAVISINCIT